MTSSGRCVVLGGAGFMGSHLVRLLAEEGAAVRVFDLPGRAAARLGRRAEQVEVVEGDCGEPECLERAVKDCETVFHLVGATVPATSDRDPVFDVEANLVATLRLLQACVGAHVRRVIFSSSGGTVYGEAESVPIPETHPTEPRSSYGITKLAIEKYLALCHRQHGLDYVVLRIGNAYGPGLPLAGEQGVVGTFLRSLTKGEPLTVWGDGSAVRDYVYVEDVARAFRAAQRVKSDFRVFNIGTGIGTSLEELIARLERITGRRAIIAKRPASAGAIRANVLDVTRARRHLGWEPVTDLDTGLRQTWEWVKSTARTGRTEGV